MADQEIIAGRTLNSKTFDLGGRLRRLLIYDAPIHFVDSDGSMKDIDLAVGPSLTMDQAPFKIDVDPQQIGMRYVSRSTGEIVTCRLMAIGSVAVASLPLVVNPVRFDRSIVWQDCLPGLTIRLRMMPTGVAFVKELSDPSVPKVFDWRITRPTKLIGVDAATEIHGRDNLSRASTGQRGASEPPTYPLELTIGRTTISDDGITTVERLKETWTGRILKKGIASADVVYPVWFDPSFSESITANADDGEEYAATTWDSTGTTIRAGSYYGTGSAAGFRFAVGDGSGPSSGDTINSATLTVAVNAAVGTLAITISADDVDDAAAWGSSSRPSQITPTTASAAFVQGAPSVTTITSIIQEIVSRGGWAQGQHIRLACINSGTGNNFARLTALEGGTAAQLDITYTASGGGGAVGPLVGGLLTESHLIEGRLAR